MLVPFLIMFREGLEAALIIGLVAGYLGRTGRREWLPLVWLGIGAGVLVSLGAGLALELLSAEFPQRGQEIFEAVVGLVAVGMLTAMVFWMRRAARSVKAEMQDRIDAALMGERRGLALLAMVFLAVAREGLEAAVFLLAVMRQSPGPAAPIGAVAGLLLAVAVGAAITWGGLRLDLRRFFRWSGVLILLVAAGLLAGSLRALHEAGLWNGLQATVFDLSDVLPADGVAGSVLAGIFGYSDRPALGEVLVYLVFLAVTLPLFLRPVAGAPAVPSPARQDVPAGEAPAPPRLRPALGLMALLVLAVLGLGAASLRLERREAGTGEASSVTVAITDRGCEPGELTVPTGRTAFRIVNRSDRALEWEILDGVMVLEERENIAPGLSQSLTARLEPGTYAITCGRIGNPRGRLTVLPAAAGAPWRPEPRDLLAPMAEYKVHVTLQAMALTEAVEDLDEALDRGDTARAERLIAEAGRARDQLLPALRLLPDTRETLTSVTDSLTRLSALLPEAGSDGSDVSRETLARLRSDSESLTARIGEARITPAAMAEGATQLLRGSDAITPDALDGVGRVVSLLRPLATRLDPALQSSLDRSLAASEKGDRNALATLATDLDRLGRQLEAH
ncbi:iron uptake transporter permease EfeU [Roseomonas gilardii]|uniref:Iron uptake transporter permease EfeU n=1 Tax=Roseomonas gilardii TaxID=257708 RepID=A0ABU3MPQ4_9PROT|nr:iron uptake transporter permease EfeU [Roseomonas gilardii]MDT8333809.1 iron uptake transporter permease EfeU [Roseomonas gilardii]